MNEQDKTLPKPKWLRIRLKTSDAYTKVSGTVNKHGLHTICQSGSCPNISECWTMGTATFMILGNICTRSCRFCAVATGKPLAPDVSEPEKVAQSVKLMGLEHCVITSVDRDDLKDGGASIWAATIKAINTAAPKCSVEVLVPDFKGNVEDIATVVQANADVYAHNIETVERLNREVRVQANYRRSLDVLKEFKAQGAKLTKSGLMLGLGESEQEILQTLRDLRETDVDIITIGQYLQPTKAHLAVKEYITPEKFDYYRDYAKNLGFSSVFSAPLVRSSYHAKEALEPFKNSET